MRQVAAAARTVNTKLERIEQKNFLFIASLRKRVLKICAQVSEKEEKR
jgi:hypothetical protein